MMSGVHRDAIQKQIHQDWANREYIEVITASIKRITDFLNSFGEFHALHEPSSASPLISHTLIVTISLHTFVFVSVNTICRYVVPISFSGVERKIDRAGTAYRLLGGMRDKR